MAILLLTGDTGLVGSAIKDCISKNHKNLNLHTALRSGYDLCSEHSVRNLYSTIKPDYVIHCAAVVGGIQFNKKHPDVLFRDNILMNTHMIHNAHQYGIKKLIAFSSTCAFRDGGSPFKEENLHDGEPYESNWAYGFAKRMVDVQIKTCNKVHNRKDLTVIPSSIYGPQDNFNLENSHFVSGLISKTHTAKKNNTPLHLWGDGSPIRELLFSEDLAKILLELVQKDTPDKLIIPGHPFSIKEVALAVTELMDFHGEIQWGEPSGQSKKVTSNARFKDVMGEFPFTSLKEGLKKTIDWYVDRKNKKWLVRGEPYSTIC